MFKKLKDRINVVSEDIKNDPRFQNGLASVNKVASETIAAINKSESSQSLQDQVSQTRTFLSSAKMSAPFQIGGLWREIYTVSLDSATELHAVC